jgi:hypothetical protein
MRRPRNYTSTAFFGHRTVTKTRGWPRIWKINPNLESIVHYLTTVLTGIGCASPDDPKCRVCRRVNLGQQSLERGVPPAVVPQW